MSTGIAEQHLKSQGNQQQANGSTNSESISESSSNYESWRGTTQPHQGYTPSTMANVNSNYYYTPGTPMHTYAAYAAAGVAATPYISNYSVYTAVPPASYYYTNGTAATTSGDYASVAQNQWNHFTTQADNGKLVDRMQGMSLGDPMAAPPVKKQPSWASIASQPAKPTTTATLHVKKKGMPPPPMLLNKLKLDPSPAPAVIKPPPPPPVQSAYAMVPPLYTAVPQGLPPPNFLSTPPPHHVPMSQPPPNLLSTPPPSTSEATTNNTKDQAPPQPVDSSDPNCGHSATYQQGNGDWGSGEQSNNCDNTPGNNYRNEGHYDGGSNREDTHNEYSSEADHYNSHIPQQQRRSPSSADSLQHSQHNRQHRSSEVPHYEDDTPCPPATDTGSHLLEELQVKNNYNPEHYELPPRPRFFVIKSYSEDDIHRSIKYEIWCSTDHGNKKLDQAFADQTEAGGSILLFFSVNRSGHFCGVARMMSNVDYNASSSVWSQDKWKGQFKVQWIYVKDVPNSHLKNIILETNENRPVTYCRDTTEVPYEKGIQVLDKIQQFSHTTSIFDDFNHYEQRQQAESSGQYHEKDNYNKDDREHHGGRSTGYQTHYSGPNNGYNGPNNGYNGPNDGYNGPNNGYNGPSGGYNKRSDGMRRSERGEWRDNTSGGAQSRRGGRGDYHQSRGNYQRPRGNSSGYYNRNSGYQRDFNREREFRGDFSRDGEYRERDFNRGEFREREFSRAESRDHRDSGRDMRRGRNSEGEEH